MAAGQLSKVLVLILLTTVFALSTLIAAIATIYRYMWGGIAGPPAVSVAGGLLVCAGLLHSLRRTLGGRGKQNKNSEHMRRN